jgi:hypothetical protein
LGEGSLIRHVILESTKHQLQRSESEKLIFLRLVNKLLTFHANRNFVALFTPAATEIWPKRAEFIFTLYKVIQNDFLFISSNTVVRVYGVLLLNNWGRLEESTHFEHGSLSADFQCGHLAALQSQDGVGNEQVVLCAPLS